MFMIINVYNYAYLHCGSNMTGCSGRSSSGLDRLRRSDGDNLDRQLAELGSAAEAYAACHQFIPDLA